MKEKLVFVVCGPSGVGKGTLMGWLFRDCSDLVRCISCTTRPKQDNEVDRVDYHFLSEQEFRKLKRQDLLFGDTKTSFRQFGFLYGIRLSDLTASFKKSNNVLIESNLNGVGFLKSRSLKGIEGAKVISIFIYPPSLDILEQRLKIRERDNKQGIALRMEQARVMLDEVQNYSIDYYVLNKDLEPSLQSLKSIIKSEKERTRI